ncbi:hypothetical protein [Microbacterium sp.]|uniref:hypothetical protein n=1 Tax=Microbacterium sp. TaxID=51671 RepID=UPI002D78337E|nr:hypothetical protein [Microbacterium sp.]HET6302432.1 hypothetical protein [Microbacterium sp.]
MSDRRTGWPKGRIGWAVGTVVLLGLGALVGTVLGSVVLGLVIGIVISIGWLIAYESWRGKTPGLDDPWDDGAQL